jgi:hypothetical protein
MTDGVNQGHDRQTADGGLCGQAERRVPGGFFGRGATHAEDQGERRDRLSRRPAMELRSIHDRIISIDNSRFNRYI